MILYIYNNGRIKAREDSPGVFNVYQLTRRIFGRSYDEKRIAGGYNRQQVREMRAELQQVQKRANRWT